ncbi:MAG: PAS domain-containing protein [Vicingaceae bacterium]
MLNSKHIQNELAIKGTRIGVWDWDMINGDVAINERWAGIIGYKKSELEPVKYDTWGNLLHPKDFEVSAKIIEDHLAGNTDYYDTQFRMRHKNGQWVWVHSRGKVFEWDNQKKPSRMSGTHIDITKQKNLELNLKKAIAERDTLLQEVHHRVKNNLQILLSLTRLKSRNGFIESQSVIDSIQSISSAYDALYKGDRIDEISVGMHLKEVVGAISDNLGFEFSIDAEEVIENITFLIPIGLIVSELTNNSIKYAHEDPKKLRLTISIKKHGKKLEVLYSDNGKGYNNSLKNKDASNSFGIKILEGLTAQLNGTIELYDQNGACAKLTVPLPNQ